MTYIILTEKTFSKTIKGRKQKSVKKRYKTTSTFQNNDFPDIDHFYSTGI